ncbi:acetyltransferase [Paenibacillus alvei A6-6i-x]|nr:acetyltransferase [Paenibacillus alvei A6-6i-x]
MIVATYCCVSIEWKMNVTELNAVALLNNISSNRVIQKCGFIQYGEIDIEGKAHLYYKLRKSEWAGK